MVELSLRAAFTVSFENSRTFMRLVMSLSENLHVNFIYSVHNLKDKLFP